MPIITRSMKKNKPSVVKRTVVVKHTFKHRLNPPRVKANEGVFRRREEYSANKRLDSNLVNNMGTSTDAFTKTGRRRVEFYGKRRRNELRRDEYDDDDEIYRHLSDDEDSFGGCGYDEDDGFLVNNKKPLVYANVDNDEESVLSYTTEDDEYDSEYDSE